MGSIWSLGLASARLTIRVSPILDFLLDIVALIPGGRPGNVPIWKQVLQAVLGLLVLAGLVALFVWWRNR